MYLSVDKRQTNSFITLYWYLYGMDKLKNKSEKQLKDFMSELN